MNNWREIIQDWLFPPTCLLCGAAGLPGRDLCPGCARELPYLRSRCMRCALPLAVSEPAICGACLQRPPAFDSAEALLAYREPVRHMVHALKFHRRYAFARLLGTLLADAMASRIELPERLIPVPLHPTRFRERGFNPSAEIAREISHRTGVRLEMRCIRRCRPTAPQVGLPAVERARNVRGAFAVSPGFRGAHVAIVDDVMTTGSTVNELAKALRRAGVERIEVWACARASLDRSDP